MNMKKQIILLLGFTLYSYGFSQDTIRISQKEVAEKVVEKNLQIKLAKNEATLAKAELLQTRAMYLPNVNASYTYTNTNNPLYAFGSKLNQARITMMDFDPTRLNTPESISNFATKVEIQQPIINLDAVYQKKAGLAKADAMAIKAERTKEYLSFEIKKAYMQLQLAYRMLETLENAKKTTFENKKVMDNYFKNGLIQKTEVLYMDVRVKEIENQLAYAKSNVKNASDYLLFLLDEDYTNKVLLPTEKLEYQTQILDQNASFNLDRKDLQAYEKSLEAYNYMIKSSKAKFLPRLNAFGSYELYDHKFANFNANGYLAGVQLSWNVFDGLKSKSEAAKYQAELNKAQTEVAQYTKQSQLEFNKASRQVSDADNKVNLAKLSLEQSKEAYRIRKNRYEQGLEKASDLLMSETTMSQKDLEYQQAIFEYNVSQAYYQFLKQ